MKCEIILRLTFSNSLFTSLLKKIVANETFFREPLLCLTIRMSHLGMTSLCPISQAGDNVDVLRQEPLTLQLSPYKVSKPILGF